MTQQHLNGTVRKELIMRSALALARDNGYDMVRRDDIARHAGVASGLVSRYWGTMKQVRRAIMREAVRTEDLVIIAQGIAKKDHNALKAPDNLKRRALRELAGL